MITINTQSQSVLRCWSMYSLGGDFNELLDELDSSAECWAKQHLSHHPQLHFIAALQQQL